MTNPGGSSCRLQYHYAGILMHRNCAALRERRRMARRPADFQLLRQSMTVGHARRQRRSVDLIKEAPLAVMGSRPTPGIFPFDQYSSVTFLIDAISQDVRESEDQPRDRRLMLLPRAEV